MSYKIYKDHIFKNDTLLSNEYIVNELNDLDYYKQEIEKLTELCNKYEEEHRTAYEIWKKAINIIKEVREKVDNFDVFKKFTFPLMKREEEQQVKSSIDYEWRKSVKKPILEILDKVEENK